MASKGYCTEAMVEAELGTAISATSTPTSTELDVWIEEAEKDIEERADTTFTSSSFTDEIIHVDRHNSYNRQLYNENYYYQTEYPELRVKLPYKPILTISSASRNTGSHHGADSWESLTEQTGSGGDFIIDKQAGEMVFLKTFPIPKKRSLKITGTYGFSSVPLHVQRLCTLLVVKRVIMSRMSNSQYSSTDSITVEGISISKGVTQSQSYMDGLKAEIDELWKRVGDFNSTVV